jgi:hypothetical protein
MSIHPTMTNQEIEFICDAIQSVAENFLEMEKDYSYNSIKNEFIHKGTVPIEQKIIENWFQLSPF